MIPNKSIGQLAVHRLIGKVLYYLTLTRLSKIRHMLTISGVPHLRIAVIGSVDGRFNLLKLGPHPAKSRVHWGAGGQESQDQGRVGHWIEDKRR